MQAKYIEIPINTQVASGTMDLVINSRASSTLRNGTNSSLGNAVTASNAAGGVGYPTPAAVGVATIATTGTGTGMTVTFAQSGGVVTVNTVAIARKGTGYSVGDAGTITTGNGAATYAITDINNSSFPAQINDAAADFNAAPAILVGDKIYANNAAVATITAVNGSGTNLTCDSSTAFLEGGETYNIRAPKVLTSTGATFTARKVRIGDRVDNTTAGTNTTVAGLISETSLTLLADIFGPAGAFDDNFTITPLLTQVYDPTATFLTTVTADDVVDNTTDGVTATILSVVDDFRITTSSALMFGDGDAYTIFDQSSTNFPLFSVDKFIYTDRGADNFTTKIYLDSNNTLDVLNITHSDQGSGRLVSAAIENSLIRGAIGVNMPEPPGPAAARVLMPIFNGSQVVVETLVLASS